VTLHLAISPSSTGTSIANKPEAVSAPEADDDPLRFETMAYKKHHGIS
jgi:hypothetical protein